MQGKSHKTTGVAAEELRATEDGWPFEKSTREVGEALGIPHSTVSHIENKALQKLRKLFYPIFGRLLSPKETAAAARYTMENDPELRVNGERTRKVSLPERSGQ